MVENAKQAAWIPCDMCEDYLCTLHPGQHAWECDCPRIDLWNYDPYSPPPEGAGDPYPGYGEPITNQDDEDW